MLCAGTGLLQPDIRLDAGILALPSEQQRAIGRRLTDWLDAQKQRHLRPLLAMAQQSRDAAIAPPLRAVLAQLADAGGIHRKSVVAGQRGTGRVNLGWRRSIKKKKKKNTD